MFKLIIVLVRSSFNDKIALIKSYDKKINLMRK